MEVPRNVVVGGGWAGLSCATALAERDHPVTLLEERRHLGGRACSFRDAVTGEEVTIVGADALEPVARRWKTQINEIAKAWAQFEALPEADHNTLEGLANPADNLAQIMALFLRAPSYHPRNRLRTELTKTILMLEGLNTDFIEAQGNGRLAHQWTALHFGDYTAYYLAMAYGVDPTPVEHLADLKDEMAKA